MEQTHIISLDDTHPRLDLPGMAEVRELRLRGEIEYVPRLSFLPPIDGVVLQDMGMEGFAVSQLPMTDALPLRLMFQKVSARLHGKIDRQFYPIKRSVGKRDDGSEILSDQVGWVTVDKKGNGEWRTYEIEGSQVKRKAIIRYNKGYESKDGELTEIADRQEVRDERGDLCFTREVVGRDPVAGRNGENSIVVSHYMREGQRERQVNEEYYPANQPSLRDVYIKVGDKLKISRTVFYHYELAGTVDANLIPEYRVKGRSTIYQDENAFFGLGPVTVKERIEYPPDMPPVTNLTEFNRQGQTVRETRLSYIDSKAPNMPSELTTLIL